MLGMEMMISNLIGMKPEEMKQSVTQVMTALENASNMLVSINERLTAIENHLNGDDTNGGPTNGRKQLPSNGEYIQL